MGDTLDELKRQMCEIGHRIWLRGYCAGNEGNHTIRIDEQRVLCTPTGISKGFMTPDDLCVVDMDGNPVEPNPSGRQRTSEVMIHLALYKKRPDVGAIVHSHPPHAVAFCIANVPLPQGVHPEAEVFLGRTVFAEYATPGGPALADSFLGKVTDSTTTVLMANHGSVSLGHDLTEAYFRLEILDNYCKQLILARSVGEVRRLNDQQLLELAKLKAQFGFTGDRAD